MLEQKVYWSFDLLKERYELKMKDLALVNVEDKYELGKRRFRYTDLTFYVAKPFEEFIKLIDKGYITVNINVGVYKGEYRHGKIRDHGTSFSIAFCNLEKLYDKKVIDL